MPSYICKVRTSQGQVIKVRLTEEDKIACMKKLKRNGMTPIEIKLSLSVPKDVSRKISASIIAKRKENLTINLSSKIVKSIKIEDLKKFTQELLILRKSKFDNIHALKTIIANTENKNFKNILREILKNLERDIYIYETMEKYNQVFPFIYINLIKNGELTGLLDDGLKNAMVYLENEEKLENVLQEKVFPNILLIFSTALVMFLSVVIGIPLMEKLLFNINLNIELPIATKIVLGLCNFIVYKWYIFAILICICVLNFVLKYRTEEGRLKIDEFKYKNKIFGKLFYLIDFSRIARCIVINAKNKMRLQDSLEICKTVVKNTYMIDTIENSINGIFRGDLWVDAFAKDKIINPIVTEILKKAAEVKSTELISRTVEYLEQQIDKQVEKVLDKLTEISYITLGILFLIYIGTVLLPCISIYLSSFLIF